MVKLNATIVTQENYGMRIEKNKEEILINEIAGTKKLNVESVVFEYDVNYESDCIELIGNLSVEEIEAHFNRVVEYVEIEGGLILEDEKLDQVRTKKEVTPTFDGINRIAGEPKNNYYYGLKVQNIKVDDLVCVTSGMAINKVLEVKRTAKGITLVLENNRARNFRNDTIVILANQGLKQVDINIIDLVNDGCMALMMEEIILNNNIDKYKNVIKNHSDKIELYREHLEILGLIKKENKTEATTEVQEIAPTTQDQEIEIIMNEEKKGIEIKFNSKPTEEVRAALKENGFRWSRFNKVWYTKQSQETINFANSLKAPEVQEVEKTEVLESKQINKNTIENKVNNFVKLFQNDHIKEMQIKKYNFYNIVSSDFRKKYILVDIGTSGRYMVDKETQIIYAVNGYGKVNKNKKFGTLDTIKSYYWGNFQGLKLKEEREIDFNNLLTIEGLKGSINEELKTVNTCKKQEVKEADTENKKIKTNSISINDTSASQEIKNKIIANGLTYDLIDFKANIKNVENKNFFITCLYPSLNKNNCLVENKKEIKRSSYLMTCKVIEIIELQENDYSYFKNHLLSDYAFLSKKGGYNEEYENIILITCSNKETLIINPQGYSYARYAGQLVEIIEGDLLHEKNIIFSNGIIKEHENKIINTNLYKVKFNQENIITDTRVIHNDYINLTCVTGLTLKEFIREGKYINFDLEVVDLDRIKYYLNALYSGDVVELFTNKTNEIKKINFENRLEKELKRASGNTTPPEDHDKKNNLISNTDTTGEKQELKKALGTPKVNTIDCKGFKNITTLKDKYITNWHLIPEEIQKFILSCDSYYIELQEVLIYKNNRIIASLGSILFDGKVEIKSAGAGELFQWNEEDGYTLNNLVVEQKENNNLVELFNSLMSS